MVVGINIGTIFDLVDDKESEKQKEGSEEKDTKS